MISLKLTVKHIFRATKHTSAISQVFSNGGKVWTAPEERLGQAVKEKYPMSGKARKPKPPKKTGLSGTWIPSELIIVVCFPKSWRRQRDIQPDGRPTVILRNVAKNTRIGSFSRQT